MSGPVIDIYLVYEFIKRLVMPFDKTDAFKLGLIDADGKKLKKAETQEEHRAMGYFDRLVFNLKRLLAKVPGGKTQIASYAAALLLMREQKIPSNIGDDPLALREELVKTIYSLEQLDEDAPAVSTAGVVGTGDNAVSWRRPIDRRRHGKAIDGVMFMRRKRYEQLRKMKA
jgi:hypothetical protein